MSLSSASPSDLAVDPSTLTGPDAVADFRSSVVNKLLYSVGKDTAHARERDWYVATALATRDHVSRHWMDATRRTYSSGTKRVYYFSLEFLIGRQLMDALGNLGLTETAREALRELGVDLDKLRTLEPDPGLGNGGLGRLAACFMESMATLQIPAYGYGIRYDHGIFRQQLRDGWQIELPEEWLSAGFPWEFERPEVAYTIGFGGHVDIVDGPDGKPKSVWHPVDQVKAVAYDTPMTGWRGAHVNTLRLWSARAMDPIDLADFNRGDHVGALADRVRLEAISRVLYPSDDTPAGHELRLRQEMFFASASLQDLLRRHLRQYGELTSLPDHAAIQLNDTHPVIAIPELMRLLVDIHGMSWDAAWEITRSVFNYTNHTLLPEALEKWSVSLMESLLPRHMQIIYLINAEHLDALRRRGTSDAAQLATISLIEENGSRSVRMGNLAFLAARHVNGVSALHTELMRQTVFKDFHALYPDRILNKTNGITFRRWLFEANPGLTRLITDTIGPAFQDDLERLRDLEPFAEDAGFRAAYAAVRRNNKIALSKIVTDTLGVRLDPDAIFDVHIKRIHEYKRQLLNILETIAIYNAMRARPHDDWVPRVRIFAGKAAAGYHTAKLIIKLVNDVAKVVNRDPVIRDRLKVVFLPNYNVSLAESIIPAADLSEQISTAGMEASGTGNMKLALNGALTIGTLDGANIEISEHVGRDNIFIFGLLADEVEARRAQGLDMSQTIAASSALQQVLDDLEQGVFSPDDRGRYRGLVNSLRHHDHFMVCADFDAFHGMQYEVGKQWRTPDVWWRKAVLNTARTSWFSSDRTIREYATEIWDAPPPR
jgi:glycogen phosphorylase